MAFSKRMLVMTGEHAGTLTRFLVSGLFWTFWSLWFQSERMSAPQVWTCTNHDKFCGRALILVPGGDRLYVHVHGPDLAGFVLFHPQLPVFGWIHALQQLVHRLHRLQTRQNQNLRKRWYDFIQVRRRSGNIIKAFKEFKCKSPAAALRTSLNHSKVWTVKVWSLSKIP